MNSNATIRFFNSLDKLVNYLQAGHTSISEVQIVVVNAIVYEIFGLVCFVVESNHRSDSDFLENGNIGFWADKLVLNRREFLLLGHREWSQRESWMPVLYQELSNSNLRFLLWRNVRNLWLWRSYNQTILVWLHVLDPLSSPAADLYQIYCTTVSTRPVACISKWFDGNLFEGLVGLLSSESQAYYLEGTHEICWIGSLVFIGGCLVIDDIGGQFGLFE